MSPPSSVAPSLDLRLALLGKTALVGGASQGIGRATAQVLAEMGAQVIAMARDRSKLESLVADLPGTGHSVLCCDVGDLGRLEAGVKAELQARTAIDVLVCNAGGPKAGPLEEATAEQFTSAFAQHVLANALLARLCLPRMREKRWGRIVNVVSTSVKIPIANLGVSNTIRAAVAGFAKTLSLEVAAEGVTVNNVLPGFTRTPRLESLFEGAVARGQQPRADVERDWLRTIPAGRFAEAREVALAIGFLASPLASYVNGTSLPVDGGRTGSL